MQIPLLFGKALLAFQIHIDLYDRLLREHQNLRKGWYIERCDETRLLTSMGEIQYHKTYFRNREIG